jgi:Phr family secreted Rap phosphatase inhibitor
MKKILMSIILVATLLISFNSPVSSQNILPDVTHFGIFEVDIRPEFDNPQVLVIYHIVLAADTKLPATVTIALPGHIGTPTALAWVDPVDSNMYNLTFQSKLENDLVKVTFTTTGNEIQLEYYDPNLNKSGTVRNFTYAWMGKYDVDNFSIHIQPPVGAQKIVITPNIGEPQFGESGVEFFYAKLGAISSKDSFNINIAYEKLTDELSIEKLPVTSTAPIDDSATGRTSIQEIIPWIVGIFLLILAGSIAWWIWISRHSESRRDNRLKRHLSAQKAQKTEERENDYVYCLQCGQRAAPGDLFCRTCGTKLKE